MEAGMNINCALPVDSTSWMKAYLYSSGHGVHYGVANMIISTPAIIIAAGKLDFLMNTKVREF